MLEYYTIMIEVRDSDGMLLRDESGAMRTHWVYETKTTKEQAYEEMKRLKTTLQTWMPDRSIDIELSYFNEISRTYPVIAYLNCNNEIKELT